MIDLRKDIQVNGLKIKKLNLHESMLEIVVDGNQDNIKDFMKFLATNRLDIPRVNVDIKKADCNSIYVFIFLPNNFGISEEARLNKIKEFFNKLDINMVRGEV